jgi:putative DNA primase/helicase
MSREEYEAHHPDQAGDVPALAELQARRHWVCWRRELRPNKKDKQQEAKCPYDPRTGREAKADTPRTWSSYEQAQQAYERSQETGRPYNGIGYVFNGETTGIDFDYCIAADGTIDAWARPWIERIQSYTEFSPSDEGFHLLVHGAIPRDGIRQGLKGKRHPKAAIEIYTKRHYFTVTGKHLAGTPTTIEARQEALDALYQELLALRNEEAEARNKATGSRSSYKTDVSSRPGQGMRKEPEVILDDDTLLQKAMQASNGAKFRALFYGGNTSGYPSASEADMALCMMLAFWTGKDLERMDRLYRKSALYRDKWDSARSDSTYGWETLHRAAARCRLVYDPQQSARQLEQNISQVLQQIATERTARKRQSKPYQLTPKEVDTDQVLRYLGMNEYGDALFFAAVFSGQVCYDHTDGTWYLWNGHHWKPDLTGKVRQLVAGVLGSLYLRAAAALNTTHAELGLKIQAAQSQARATDAGELASWQERYKVIAEQMDALQKRVSALRSAKRNANVLRFVESEMGVTSEVWDRDPWLLPVPNGVLDLHTGTCRDGEPGDYIRTVAPTEWTGLETSSPRIEQFLHEVFEDKPDADELIAFVHRLLGYCITGLTTVHVFPIFYGPEGRNGKDTLLSVLKAVLGPLVGAVSNDVFIAQDKLHTGGAATPHLSALQGKRLAWGSETRQGDRLNVAQIKQLTGGGEISTRPPYAKDFYTFTPTHKLLLITNYKPHAEARDKAFWSRACLIEFTLRFVDDPKEPNERKNDPHLKETLQQEASGILAWLVRGCLAWQQQGLDMPASVQLATDRYREEEDRLLLFIQECCLVKPEAYVRAHALFTAYRIWHEDNQFGGRSMNGKLFGDEMGKRFPKKHTKAGTVYQGIGIRSTDPQQQQTLFEEGQEAGDGSVTGITSSTKECDLASEANAQGIDQMSGDGSDGIFHKNIITDHSSPSIEEVYGKKDHIRHPPPPVDINKSTSEANAVHTTPENRSVTDPSPSLPGGEEWEHETL